jgi:hypothetical protein
MRILGDWNWYLPKWLEWLPRVGTEDEAASAFGPADRDAPAEPPAADPDKKPVAAPV